MTSHLSSARGFCRPAFAEEGRRLGRWGLRPILFAAAFIVAFSSFAQGVAPLLGDTWRHQEHPFNLYCPHYDQSEERCLVGCVATACETILTYHQRPITLQDTLHGWTTDHYTIPDILPGESVRPHPDDDEAIARLGYWCGVACRMNYGLNASGADIERLEVPLRKAFGLKYVHYLDSYKYAPSTWHAIIRQELRSGRPVLYAGYSCHLNGHAFVIDGYREDGLYHVNWGYGGHYDNHWYALDELYFANPDTDRRTADSPEGFFCNQELLLLHPDSIHNPLLADTLSRTGVEIDVRVALPKGGLVAGRYNPLTFTLTNTTDQALTTPFLLVSNEAERTDSLLEKADDGLIFGAVLQPRESRQLTLPALFDKAGDRVLRITTDDEHFVWQQPCTIVPAEAAPALQFTPPVITTDGTTARCALQVDNPSATQAGTTLIYCLFTGSSLPDEADGDTRHHSYLYTAPYSSETLQMDFQGLTPGQTYTLLLRAPWQPLFPEGHTFTVPASAGIDPLPASAAEEGAVSIDLCPTRLRIGHRSKTLERTSR